MIRNTRSSTFWIIFASLSLLSGIAALRLFPRAFPIITLNVSLDRTHALEEAAKDVQQFHLGPQNYTQSASFVTDSVVKTFVELECGGAERFAELVAEKLYYPYTWQIRHFTPYDPHELLLQYTPDGQFYGFIEKIPDQLSGPSLNRTEAQTIAQTFMQEQWHTDLTHYTLAEASQETVESGRTDHTFVYERNDTTIGEGFYRCTTIVSGDRVTQLTHSIKVPDNFLRRYQQLRTANDTIARIAQILILLLYLLGGMIGLVFFMRRKWIIWRPAITAGFVIAILHFCMRLNELPLAWMHYQTALSPLSFILQIITTGIYQFIYTMLLYSLIFAIAETFTRSAFGSYPQFWQLWTLPSASSTRLIHATIIGYLAVPFFILFAVVFYIIAHTKFGWWVPSQAFFEPDVLATYVPWFSSLSQALSAGFMEECLFRAIPIAGALLLSRKYGRQSVWLIAAFIIQAFIFGAGHANYPMQPAYARVVELLIPSCGFGALYYFVGLFPAIISHVIYDVVWMALPIFMNNAPDAWIHKLIVILISLLPLWISLCARLKQGAWTELPIIAHNEYWRPTTPPHNAQPVHLTVEIITFQKTPLYFLYALALVSLCSWVYFARFTADAPSMTINRDHALEIAQDYFARHNIPITDPWKLLTHIADEDWSQVQHAFVWQTGTPQIYHQLQGTYLSTPEWVVRAAQFEGDIVARAEQYHIYITSLGTICRVHHQLPETLASDSLSQPEARKVAHTALVSKYALDPQKLTEISAQEVKHPARKDWIFTFADPDSYPLSTGQARICVEIAGTQVVDSYRYIFVPQEWRRSFEHRSTIAHIIKQLCGLCIYLIFIAATLGSLWHLASAPTHHASPALLFLILCALFVLSILNGLPKITFIFSNCRSWNNQLLTLLAAYSISALIKAATLAGTTSAVHMVHRYSRIMHNHLIRILAGCSLGIIFAGYITIAQKIIPPTLALWPSHTYLNSYIPGYEFLASHLISYLSFTILVMLIIILAQQMSRYYRSTLLFSYLFLALCSLIFAGAYYAHNIPLLLVIALGIAIVLATSFYIILKFDYTIIPLATASYTCINLVQEGMFHATSYTMLYAIITILSTMSMALIWYKLLNTQSAVAAE